ncbi:MAG: PilZ domain-containing protein [Candidatus Omnitrophica bacterium]|nr:PilZ domain-containing protein [Candidatus Omnitrophota bacterium]MBU4488877.1 PilZ domain-containing protein [Candidatus Omnitrophota bacterium]MCG2705465.1 PilZ domain-containing protein [Candidatus Omnitrophota bacterium]
MKRIIEERRRFIRLEVPIELKYIVEDNPSQTRMRVATKDLSCDGLRFISEHKIDEGSALDLNLTIPGANNPVHIKGKAVWVRKMSSEDAAPFEVGVEFAQIEEDNKNTFLKYLCDLIYNETKIMGRNKKAKE